MSFIATDTPAGEARVVVAQLTPAGRGALAVVGVAGPSAAALVDAMFTARGGRPLAGRPDAAIACGRWGGPAGEELVAVRQAAGCVEVHCHGGLAAAAAIVAGLVARGAREVGWREWLRAVAPADGTVAVEAREALPQAGGPRAAGILCRQLAGAFDAEVARIARLIAAGAHEAAHAAGTRLLRASRVGLRLTRPWRVVMAGAVNAGKSSLVNALAGHARTVVSPIPGTTRDLVETRIVLAGWEIDLVDTAGLRDRPTGAVEAEGIARAVAAAAAADLVLRVEPAAAAPPATVPGRGRHELLVRSKSDLAAAAGGVSADAVLTSAATGAGIDELARRIVAAVVPEESAEPDLLAAAVPFTPRQVAVVRDLIDGLSAAPPVD